MANKKNKPVEVLSSHDVLSYSKMLMLCQHLGIDPQKIPYIKNWIETPDDVKAMFLDLIPDEFDYIQNLFTVEALLDMPDIASR